MNGMDKGQIGTVWRGHENTRKEVPSLLASFPYHLRHFPMDEDQLESVQNQRSPTFLAPGTGFVEDNFSTDWRGQDGFGMIEAHYIYCALYFYYYYIVIYNEIIMQLTIMQNKWEP